jgi:predicted ATPase/DNA-binding CsgD family transcriptional regulator
VRDYAINTGHSMAKSQFDRINPMAEPLTRQELEVLRRLASDLYNREIADALQLAPNSIKWYTRQIYAKLGVSSRKEAIQRAGNIGLLNPEVPPGFRLKDLPVSLTPFIGRQDELRQIGWMLSDPANRLVTLTGAGGVGKTRLAVQAARVCKGNYIHSAWMVTLASLTEPELVPQSVAAIFNLHPERARTVLDGLIEYLYTKQLLLVLDNCEHLVAACAAMVSALLQACPGLQVLATSREALGIPGECTYLVPSLSLPEPGQILPPAKLLKYEAVDLFTRRAKAALPGFELNKQNAQAVLKICRELDGIPLALELAAARLKVMDMEEIAGELDDRLRLLRGGDRTAPARLQTMRASIDWSYQLLPESEKILLRRVSVFAGGWSMAAARAICADQALPEADILDLLDGLINKSLVLVQRNHHRALRYRLLETVVQYAAGKASQAGEVATLRDRHLAYYRTLASQAAAEIEGVNPLPWLKRMEDELDNLRHALEWALATNAEAGLQLLTQIDLFWYQRGHVREQYGWLESFLDSPESQGFLLLRVKALEIQSYTLTVYMGDSDRARACTEKGLDLAREIGDRRGEAAHLYQLGYLATGQGDVIAGRKLYEESLAMFRQLADGFGQARVLAQLGYISSNDPEKACQYAQEALVLSRKTGNQLSISRRLVALATLACRKGDYAAAEPYIQEGVSIQRKLELRHDLAESLDVFGRVAFRQGHPELARASYLEGIALNDVLGRSGENIWPYVDLAYLNLRLGQYDQAHLGFVDSLVRLHGLENMGGVSYIIDGLASLAVAEGKMERAARLFVWVDFNHRKNGSFRPTNEQADVDQDLALMRAHLHEGALTAAAAAGQAMTIAEAIAFAINEQR